MYAGCRGLPAADRTSRTGLTTGQIGCRVLVPFRNGGGRDWSLGFGGSARRHRGAIR